jgi:PAS domain S-box-containing protein
MLVTQSLLHRPGLVGLAHFLNTQPCGFWLFDPQLKSVFFLNGALSALTGVTDLAAEHGCTWIHAEDRQRILAELGDWDTQEKFVLSYRVLLHEKGFQSVRSEVRVLALPEGPLYVAELTGELDAEQAHQTITRTGALETAESAQERLRVQQSQLRTILESIGEGIAMVDNTGEVLTFNATGSAILGQTGAVGKPERWAKTFGIFYPDTQVPIPAEQVPLYRALQGETVRNFEMIIHTPQGEPRQLLVTASPLIGPDGVQIGAVSVFRDITSLRQAQDDARATQARLQYILERFSDGFLTVNQAGSITSYNPAAQVLFSGLTQGPLTLWTLLSDESGENPGLQTAFQQAFRDQSTLHLDEYYPVLDARYVIDAYPYGNELALFIRDETEAWRHEQMLALEKEVLTAALDSTFSLEQPVSEALARFEALFAKRRASLIRVADLDESLPQVIAPPLSRKQAQTWEALLAEHPHATWDAWLPAEGATHWVSGESLETVPIRLQAFTAKGIVFLPIRSGQGELLAVFSVEYEQVKWMKRIPEVAFLQRLAFILRTLLESKQQARLLQASHERYELLAEATNDAVWDLDIQEQQITWNASICKLFGYPQENRQTDAAWWEQRIHPDDHDPIVNSVQAHLQQRQTNWQGEYRFRCADGSYRWVLNRAHLIFNSQSTPIRIMGSMQDISQLKQHEAFILAQNQRLMEIAWQQSHEVRRPLANILGLIPLLEGSDERSQIIAFLNQEALEMDRIIHSIVQKSGVVWEYEKQASKAHDPT